MDPFSLVLFYFKKYRKKIPSLVFSIYYNPIPKWLRKSSLSENKKKPERYTLPREYKIDDSLIRSWSKRVDGDSGTEDEVESEVTILKNVYITRSGVIVKNSIISRCSSCFASLSLFAIFNALSSRRRYKNLKALDSATLIPRGLIDQGTYGDYVIEFLLPLSGVSRTEIEGPFLLDAEFIQRFAPEDLSKLNHKWINIPRQGVLVKTLKVVGPVQYWDNFRRGNVKRVKSLFLKTESSRRDEHIYLSRVGISSDPSAKQFRAISNEEDIEKMLTSRGFKILRTHNMNNDEIRSRLTSAKAVVASHGAAMTHLIFSSPEYVLEIGNPNWWVPCYLKLCLAIGVGSYAAIAAKDNIIDIERLKKVLDELTCGR